MNTIEEKEMNEYFFICFTNPFQLFFKLITLTLCESYNIFSISKKTNKFYVLINNKYEINDIEEFHR